MGRGLASIEPIELAGAVVRPATCEIDLGHRVERLEPRVMQVLVAMIAAQGRVVSRDELVEQCWDGLTVGDDAINRVTARLRRLGQDSGVFALETVRKVGYRLVPDGAEDRLQQPIMPRAAAKLPARRAARVNAILNGLLLLGLAVVTYQFGSRQGLRDAQVKKPAAPAALALARLPGRWGMANCLPTYDLVVRGGSIVMTAPGYRVERRILSGNVATVLTEGVLPVEERGRLIEYRVDGERMTVQNRSTDSAQVFVICPATKR